MAVGLAWDGAVRPTGPGGEGRPHGRVWRALSARPCRQLLVLGHAFMMQTVTGIRAGLWTTRRLWTTRPPPSASQPLYQPVCPPPAEAVNGWSVRTISRPIGSSETGISLKLATPSGMPMIVTHSAMPVTM